MVIDVRTIPTGQRHPRIFAAFDALSEGEELEIQIDHEPRPLRIQFEQERRGNYIWIQRMLGDEYWTVRLRRVLTHQGHARRLDDELRQLSVFCDSSAETICALAEASSVKILRKRMALIEQDETWPYLGVVLAGVVQALVSTPLGREQMLQDIFPGEPFGHIALLDNGASIARFVASAHGARIAMFPRDLTRTVAERDPGFARALAIASAQTARLIAARFAAHLSQPTLARVASALLPYAAPDIGLAPAPPPLHGLSQSQIATSAGTVKEVVNRALAELEREHAIARDEGRIVRLDRIRLTEIANR